MNADSSTAKHSVTRADFLNILKWGGASVAAIGLGLYMRHRMIEAGTNEAESYAFTTIGEIMQTTLDAEEQILIPAAQAVFGPDGRFSPQDQVIVMAAPPNRKSLVLEVAGFTGGSTQKKGGLEIFGIQIQRYDDTASRAIMADSMTPYPNFVVRETNAASKFRALVPAFEPSSLPFDNRGFGLVDSPAGPQPLLICLETTPDTILMVTPNVSFWANNGHAIDLPSLAQVSVAPASFPAFDP